MVATKLVRRGPSFSRSAVQLRAPIAVERQERACHRATQFDLQKFISILLQDSHPEEKHSRQGQGLGDGIETTKSQKESRPGAKSAHPTQVGAVAWPAYID
jgi:hypothetical protein